MATITLNNVGTNAVASANIAVANAAEYILTNDSDAAVSVTLTAGARVGVTEGLTHKVDAKSYITLAITHSGANSTIAIGAGGVKTAHGTSAQDGERVYLNRSGSTT